MRECSNVSIKFSVNVEVKQVCESAILIHFYSLSAIWETYLSKSYKLKVERIRSSVIVKFTKLPTHGLYFYEVSRGYKKILVAWNGLITKELSKWGVGSKSDGWRYNWGLAVQVKLRSASAGWQCKWGLAVLSFNTQRYATISNFFSWGLFTWIGFYN